MVVRQIGALGLIIMMITVGSLGGLAYAQDNSVKSQSQDSHIRVSSSGSIDTTPDTAVLNIGIRKTADNPQKAREITARNASNVKDTLSNMEIVENIRTTQFNIREQRKERTIQRQESRPEPQVPESQETSYVAEHVLEVKVNDINQVGMIIDQAVDSGATNIDNIRFTLSEDRQDRVKNQALREAMNRARSQAQTVADTAGISISGVKSVDASSNFGVAVRQFDAEGGGAASTSTDIEPGPVDVNSQVTVTYNIR